MSKTGSSPPGANARNESVSLFDSIFTNTPPIRSVTIAPRRFVAPKAANVETGGGIRDAVSPTALTQATPELLEKSGATLQVLPVPLPLEGFVRLESILGPKGPIPVSPSTWWAGVRSGLFPTPHHLGPRTAVWRVEDIRKIIESPPGDICNGKGVV